MPACTWRKLIDVVADMKPASADQVKPSSRNEAPGPVLIDPDQPRDHTRPTSVHPGYTDRVGSAALAGEDFARRQSF